MFLHDTVDNGQSQATTLVRILRSEVGFKNSGLLFRGHTATRVRNSDQGISARICTRESSYVLFAQFGVASSNGQRAPFRHSVARINTQIQECLLQQDSIGKNNSDSVTATEFQFDRLT